MRSNKLGQWSVRYRPKSLDDFIDNETAVSKAKGIIEKKNTHAVLFTGDTGCGKTTLARIVARGLTSNDSDIIEKNISSEGGIGDVRDLIKASQYQPVGDFKVFILDEVHALKGPAQSAILKTIEEPEHDRVVWFLCTNRATMLGPELLNRLYKIQVHKPSEQNLSKLLYRISKKEKLFSNYDKKKKQRICKEISKASELVPREALQILQEVSNIEGEFDSFKELVVEGIRNRSEGSIDKVAMMVLMAIYSTEKSAKEKAEFMVNKLFDQDLWALTMRLCDIHMHIMNYVAGIRGGPAYYYIKELQPRKAVPDNLHTMAKVGSKLATIRNGLFNLNTNMQNYVVPELVNIVFECDKKSK
jgi:DNA polymerase-3 subunit gamma/tau